LENITFGDKSITEKEVQWAMENTGLLQYVKEQPKGINTMVYPEGQQMPFTVSKKIVLARSIVRKPKLLLLKDPLIQFDEVEAIKIIKFLTDDKNPWSLIVVSQDPKWLNRFQNIITLENGKIVSKI
jgi:ABC-type transport system involved in cytochrome bd biosynthesis fused ATPase/permease subunit